MNSEQIWKTEYEKELARAYSARTQGNEGMARVCARRAAGIIIGEYLRQQGYTNLSRSVYDRTSIFNSIHNIDPRCKEITSHLLLKVNLDHDLPVNVDLISEVRLLANILLLENNS